MLPKTGEVSFSSVVRTSDPVGGECGSDFGKIMDDYNSLLESK